MNDLKTKRQEFIKEKTFFCLTEEQLEKELTERNLKKSDIIMIDDTMGFILKKDKDEFLKLFEDKTKEPAKLYTFK